MKYLSYVFPPVFVGLFMNLPSPFNTNLVSPFVVRGLGNIGFSDHQFGIPKVLIGLVK